MRKKQRVTRTVYESPGVCVGLDVTSTENNNAELDFDATKSGGRAADIPSEPVYEFDSSGTATLKDGTVVVQPVSVDIVSSSKSDSFKMKPTSLSPSHIPTVKCTVCGMEMDPTASLISSHPILRVIRCLPCAKFYRKQEFLKDSDGKDENCRWCADGGDLICCDHCSNAFCKRCIRRNLGRSALSDIESLGESALWLCYVCDPSPIKPLRDLCSEILIKVDELKVLQRRRSKRKCSSWKTRCSTAANNLSLGPSSVKRSNVSPVKPTSNCSNETLKALTSIFSQLSQSMTDSSKDLGNNELPRMGNLLHLLGQAYNTASVSSNSTVSAAPTVNNPSLSSQLSGCSALSTPVGRPTGFPQCPSTQTDPSSSLTTPTISINSDISAILDQITSVNENNIRIALKAARRCIETFSADVRRLEQMAAKANTMNDLGRVVRSFHSVYRFHLFARLSNLSCRMREEAPKIKETSRGLINPTNQSNHLLQQTGMNNFRCVSAVPVIPPTGLTIDLTNEADVSRESNDPSSHENLERSDPIHASPMLTQGSEQILIADFPVSPKTHTSSPITNDQVEQKSDSHISPPIDKSPQSDLNNKHSSPQVEPPVSSPSASSFGAVQPTLSTSGHTSTMNVGAFSEEVHEVDGLAPDEGNNTIVDDDDDDDIDWKLDMLANLSKSETPSLIFTPNTTFKGNDGEQASIPISTCVVQDLDSNRNFSEGSPTSGSKRDTALEPSVYLEDIRDRIGDHSFVHLEDESSFSTAPTQTGGSVEASSAINSVVSNSTKKSLTQASSDPESDVDLANLEAAVTSLERRCHQITEIQSSKRNNVTTVAQKNGHLSDSNPEQNVREGQGNVNNVPRQKDSKDLSSPISGIKSTGAGRCMHAPVERFDSNEEEEELASHDANSALTLDLQDTLRDELLCDADTEYNKDLAYREELLRDSSDEEMSVSTGVSERCTKESDLPKKCAVKNIPHGKSDEIPEELPKMDVDSSSLPSKGKSRVKYHGVDRKLMRKVWSSSEDESDTHRDAAPTSRDAGLEISRNSNHKSGKRDHESDTKLSSDDSDWKAVRTTTKHRWKRLRSAQLNTGSDSEQKLPSEVTDIPSVGDQTEKDALVDEDESEDDSNVALSSEVRSTRHTKRRPKIMRDRRRRVRLKVGSDEENSTNEKDDTNTDTRSRSESAAGSGSDAEVDGSPKGRKKIRKIFENTKLSETTKTAEAEERERRKRLAERQKMYNDCLIQEGSGVDLVTKKLVLEKNSNDSKNVIEVHPDILKHLKPHQVEAVRFLWDCLIESLDNQDAQNEQTRGAILAHCMGLGKTLSVIAFIHTLFSYPDLIQARTCLVVCPVNTLLNWKNEWELWLPPHDPLEVFELSNKPDNRQRVDVLKHWHNRGGVMLLGYDMFRNFVMRFAKRARSKVMKEAVNRALLDPGPDIIVCDEGHVLKNCKSALSKSISQVRTLKRIVLTGTPLQNNLTEYHAMVSFVKPNLLGTTKEFNNRFANPIKNGQHSNSTQLDVQVMKKRAHVLYKTLDGCVQRKDYAALTKYLPPRYEYVIKCRLSSVQQSLYRLFLEHRSNRTSNETGEDTGRVRRTTLFTDQQTLYRVWTHPFLLRSHETREARKMLLDDEDDFIQDGSESPSDTSSESNLASESSNSTEEDFDEVVATSSSRDVRARRRASRGPRTRSRGKDQLVCLDSDSDPAERDVERADDTHSSEDNESQYFRSRDTWWSSYYRDDFDWDASIGVKLDVLLRILKKCCDIGDKLIIFTQSLLSLDLLERFLFELHRQWLGNQGLMPENSKNDVGDGTPLERPDLSEYFSDIGLNSWERGKDYERMDGSTNAIVRKELQCRFNRTTDTRLRLFLISTRAGGLGINLIAANRIILFDACWNPSHDIQSIFRCYRFGQTKPVYIYRLIAQGTMEEIIYDRQVTKQSLSLRVIDEQQIDRHFSNSDLQALYTFEPDLWDPATAEQRPTPKLPKDRLLADMLSEYPNLIVTYHEHDSLLEHREDEGLTEEQRQEAWREYEEEKLYGMSLAQYQRQQEFQARMLRMQQQQQLWMQQQQSFPPNPFVFRSYNTTNPVLPDQTNGTNSLIIESKPVDTITQRSPNLLLNGKSYPELFEYFRAQLLSARPSLSGDPEQLKRLIMGNMMDYLLRTKALIPNQMRSTSYPAPAQLNQPGPSG